jgi:hypothetical protein
MMAQLNRWMLALTIIVPVSAVIMGCNDQPQDKLGSVSSPQAAKMDPNVISQGYRVCDLLDETNEELLKYKRSKSLAGEKRLYQLSDQVNESYQSYKRVSANYPRMQHLFSVLDRRILAYQALLSEQKRNVDKKNISDGFRARHMTNNPIVIAAEMRSLIRTMLMGEIFSNDSTNEKFDSSTQEKAKLVLVSLDEADNELTSAVIHDDATNQLLHLEELADRISKQFEALKVLMANRPDKRDVTDITEYCLTVYLHSLKQIIPRLQAKKNREMIGMQELKDQLDLIHLSDDPKQVSKELRRALNHLIE